MAKLINYRDVECRLCGHVGLLPDEFDNHLAICPTCGEVTDLSEDFCEETNRKERYF